MARSISDIQLEIQNQRLAKEELAGLNSVSASAIYKIFEYIVAAVIHLHEKFMDEFKTDIQKMVDNAISGTAPWYARELLKFQLGDNLVILPSGKLGYNVIDPDKQIIKRSSYIEQSSGLLLLKAAKEDEAGNVIPLSGSELIQAKGYLSKIQFGGTKAILISQEPDSLRAYLNVYYNSLYNPEIIRVNVENAIKAYLKNLDFNGNLLAIKLVDAIQSVEGIEDIQINELLGISNIGTTSFTRIYITRAGYIVSDATNGFELSDTITYIAQ